MPDEAMTPPTTTPANGAAPIPTTVGSTEPPKVDEKPPVEPVSDKFAALARKEKGIVKARQELSALKTQLEAQQKQMDAQMAEFKRWQGLRENAKVDPEAWLNEAGLSYGYLTERALKGGKDPNAILEAAEKKLSDWEKKQQEAAKKAEEDQKTQAQKEFEERVATFVQGIHEYVEQNKEAYELTTLHGQQNLIWEVIQEGARRKQQISVKDAADKVEAYLGEQVEKALASKRFKDRFTPVEKATETPKEAGSPTLNNSMNTTTPVSPGLISEQERMTRALNALNKALGE